MGTGTLPPVRGPHPKTPIQRRPPKDPYPSLLTQRRVLAVTGYPLKQTSGYRSRELQALLSCHSDCEIGASARSPAVSFPSFQGPSTQAFFRRELVVKLQKLVEVYWASSKTGSHRLSMVSLVNSFIRYHSVSPIACSIFLAIVIRSSSRESRFFFIALCLSIKY